MITTILIIAMITILIIIIRKSAFYLAKDGEIKACCCYMIFVL